MDSWGPGGGPTVAESDAHLLQEEPCGWALSCGHLCLLLGEPHVSRVCHPKLGHCGGRGPGSWVLFEVGGGLLPGPALRVRMTQNPDTCTLCRPRALLFPYFLGGRGSVSDLSTHGASQGAHAGNGKSEPAGTPGCPGAQPGKSWCLRQVSLVSGSTASSFVIGDISGLFWTEGLTNCRKQQRRGWRLKVLCANLDWSLKMDNFRVKAKYF